MKQKTSLRNYCTEFFCEKTKRMESSNSEFDQKPAVHEHQPRLNEVAQKFLADLDEERQRLSAEFPLCALLIDEGKGHFLLNPFHLFIFF